MKHESSKYHDIIQGNYTDIYENLNQKVLNGIFWITKNCPKVPWTLHTDDDLIINTKILFNYIKKLELYKANNLPAIHCRADFDANVQRSGKWKVDKNMYENDYFPPYCYGMFWLIPTKFLPRLINASMNAKTVWLDDVFVTGILAKKAKMFHINLKIGLNQFPDEENLHLIAWHASSYNNRKKWWKKIVEFNNSTLFHNKIQVAL